MKKSNKILIIVSVVLVGTFGIYELTKQLSPGSYPFAVVYNLNAPEKDVIFAIQQFKMLHPDFVAPNVTINNQPAGSLEESEGRKQNDHWYNIYFYFKKENKIVFTWTRSAGKNKTDFALISVNDGLDIGNWKDINNDLNKDESIKWIMEFENQILEPVRQLLPKN